MGIIAILDSAGAVVVKYVYDAWGNHDVHLLKQVYASEQSTHIGYLNPFRYRSYYYDTETKLYYLKTRYYDPVVGRFITIDDLSYIDPEHINGLNLYAYCGNNPVMTVDPTGQFFFSFLIGCLIAVAASTVVGAVVGGVSAAIHGENIWQGIGNGALFGLLLGVSAVSIATGLGMFAAGSLGAAVLVGAGVGSAIMLSVNVNEQLKNGGFGRIDTKSMFTTWVTGGVIGGISGAMSYALGQIVAYYGEMFGLALSGKTVLGLKIGAVFSSKLLMMMGNFLGGAIGGFIGSKLINYIAIDSGILNQEIPMWLATLLKFFGKK